MVCKRYIPPSPKTLATLTKHTQGIAYQLTEDDPLVNTEQCRLDADLMQTLGANAIRVYHVDPAADHDGCMSAFADAGIYTWIDLDTFDTYLYTEDGAHWNETQYDRFQKVGFRVHFGRMALG